MSGKFLSTLAAVLWLVPATLWSNGYVDEVLPAPAGILDGWSAFPDKSSSLGDAFFAVLNADAAEDSATGVWALQENSLGEYELQNIVSLREMFRVLPADIDGDGSQDLVLTIFERPVFRIYFGNPQDNDSSDISMVEYDRPEADFPFIGARDLDKDGLAEILICDYGESSEITILRAERSDSGNIAFSPSDPIHVPSSSLLFDTNKYYFGDYNGDLLTDFVFNDFLFLGQDDGGLELIELSGISGSLISIKGAEDFDGDGLTELLCTRQVTNYPSTGRAEELVFYGYMPGAEFYEKLVLYRDGISNTIDYAFGEFTGDKYSDLAIYNTFSMSMFRGVPDSIFAKEPEILITDLLETQINDNYLHVTELLGPIDWNHDGLLDWMFLIKDEEILIKVQEASLYQDKTAEVGLDTVMAGLATAVADFNLDGFVDIYIVNGSGPNALFAGSAEGTFRDVAIEAGIASANYGISCAWGDYNNDGLVDLFVAGMGYSNKLFHNNGDGTFSDSSRILYFDHSGKLITSVCWGDLDKDGWLDILLGNYDGANALLLNQKGRGFQEQFSSALNKQYKTENAVLVDVDLDGRLDVVSVNELGPTCLILNRTVGFVDQTETSGLNPDAEYKKFGQTQTWGDLNGDSYPDLYITRSQDVDMLFINSGKTGGPRFKAVFSGRHGSMYGRIAAAIADLDADGAPDIYVARSSRFGDLSASPQDLLFLGNPSRDYPLIEETVISSAGSDVPSSSDLLGFDRYIDTSLPLTGDLDQDGDLDLLLVNYLPEYSLNLFQGSPLLPSFMQNQSQINHNLVVKLRRTNNQSLVGTRVVLHTAGKHYAQVVSGGSGRIQTGDFLLFSLAASGTADSLTVYWPQGKVTTHAGPVFPGTLEIIDDRKAPVITLLELPGLFPTETRLPSNVETFYATVMVEDDSPIRSVYAELVDSFIDNSAVLIIPGTETNTPGIYSLALPAPAPGDSLAYSIHAEDIYRNTGSLPKTSYFYLKVASDYLEGDINQDGKFDIADLLRLLIILEQSLPLTEEEFYRADLNHDSQLNSIDLIYLLGLLR
ncbi:FG-GAP-like repeat-containing protein [Gemmatimonadota bacterium]